MDARGHGVRQFALDKPMLRKHRSEPTIVTDALGFGFVGDAGQERKWPWGDVVSVEAFKRDLLTTDFICFSVTLRDGEKVLLHEELDGWDFFLKRLPMSLAGFPALEEWISRVAQPPFATSVTTLYERDRVAR